MERQSYILYALLIMLQFLAHKAEAQPIVITPKWTAQAQFAGYYIADKKGFYKEEGLDVRIVHPPVSESSFSVLQQGHSQLAVMNLSFALTARAAGAKVVNIMQTSQMNSLMLVSRTPLDGLASLQDRKIAVWNHLSEDLLKRLATHYNLKGDWIRFNSGVALFLSGAVDVCLIGSYNEYLQLFECGMKEDSVYFYRFSDYGYNLPEDGLYVTDAFYNENPETVKKIVQASIKGWKWANEHPEETLDIVMEEIRRNNVGTNRYHQRCMLEEILRLQTNQSSGECTYHLSQEGFNSASAILLTSDEKDSIHYTDFVK